MSGGLAALLDDVAVLARAAAASVDDIGAAAAKAGSKAAGVVIDDAAVTPQYVRGLAAKRELPIVKRIALGLLRNKFLIILPVILVLSQFLPGLLTPLLMIGGAYLCYEGVEKLAHKLLHSPDEDAQHHVQLLEAVKDEKVDLVKFEKDKIKGAIRTDFILSAEIIVISLGTVAGVPFLQRIAVLVAIALIMTVGVYGLVGGIVKLDDLGLMLTRKPDASALARGTGRAILRAAPLLMKFLSVAGTAAMFLVGGGILVHGIPALHHFVEGLAHASLGWLTSNLFNAAVGIVAGIIVLLVVSMIGKLRKPKPAASAS